jgi:hypothetical protein
VTLFTRLCHARRHAHLRPAPRRAHRRAFVCDVELIPVSLTCAESIGLGSSTADHSLRLQTPGRRTRVRRSDSSLAHALLDRRPLSCGLAFTACGASHAWSASFVNRTPLLRFRPLQRSLAALRCPWLPCLRTIPLRRFATCRRPARPRTSPTLRRPCGVTLLGSDAVMLECGPNAACGFAGRSALLFRSKRPEQSARNATKSSIIRASESGESESVALANDPSRQATPLHQSAASCRVMHRRVP